MKRSIQQKIETWQVTTGSHSPKLVRYSTLSIYFWKIRIWFNHPMKTLISLSHLWSLLTPQFHNQHLDKKKNSIDGGDKICWIFLDQHQTRCRLPVLLNILCRKSIICWFIISKRAFMWLIFYHLHTSLSVAILQVLHDLRLKN